MDRSSEVRKCLYKIASLKVAQIRQKTGLKEGGNLYLFATTDLHQQPVVLVCEKAV
jgi:hypothetical protein